MKPTIRALLAVLLFSTLARPASAARPWVEIESPHFLVRSNDTERTARTIAWQFEQVRIVVENLWPWAHTEMSRPVVILAIGDEETMKVLQPRSYGGPGLLFSSTLVPASDRYYIALRSDLRAGNRDGINPYFDAYWAYLSIIFNSSIDARLPLWFSNGMAGVFANTLVRENEELQIGRVVPWMLRQLQQQARPHIKELIALDRSSNWYTDDARRGTLDAASWALMHWLLFGDEGVRAPKVDAFIAALEKGTAPVDAFQAVFGDPDALEDGFAKYINRPLLTYRRAKVDLRVQQDKLAARPLSAAETAMAAAGFHTATGRLTEAEAEIKAARAADPQLAQIEDVSGRRFDRASASGDALLAYEKAVSLGSTDYYTYYAMARLLLQDGASADRAAQAESLLERAVALNPSFSPGYLQLSDLKRRGGNRDEAIRIAAKAVTLEPGEAMAHLMLARGLSDDRTRLAEAITEAGRAATLGGGNVRLEATALSKRIVDEAIAALPPLPPPRPAPANALRIGGSVPPPRKIKDVPPVYPALARAAGVQGVPILEVVVGTEGQVLSVNVLRSIPLLDAAAIDAISQWTYAPTLVNGTAVPVIMTVTINFAVH